MKRIESVIISATILIMMFSCNKTTCDSTPTVNYGNCIDSNLINNYVACFEVHDPVFGCDGITYSNSCYATSFGGVTGIVSGECCD
jgi:hypothetical protein